MKRHLMRALSLQALLCSSALAGGTWAPLAQPAPAPAGHFLLLSDGAVLAENLSTNYGPGWFRLTPDIHGSYANGTWSTIAPMQYTRLDFESDVLTNGLLFVCGGEYGAGIATSEIYNPVSNTWTEVPVPTSLLNPSQASPEVGENEGFYDCSSVVIANGDVLLAPDGGNALGATMLFHPNGNVWSAGPTTVKKRYPDQGEASWVKLPDGSILTVDGGATTSERYIPAQNTWVRDANVPVALYDIGEEEGPAMLLPNGKAIFFGATSNTAIYTPSGSATAGAWAAGPKFPNHQGMPDAPAAMLVNGKVLCAMEQAATNSAEWYPPTTFYEYDCSNNTFAQVSAPGGGTNFNEACWPMLLLALPDGTVLFGHRSTDFYVYQPDGVPLAAGQPVIRSLTTNLDGSLHLTGTLFNGLCQGSAYGDDEQMDSNFPLVRFIDGVGNVRYGRTYNWSSSGVMTSNLLVSTDCAIPSGASLQDTIQVVANGISSGYIPPIVEITNDSGAGSLRQLLALTPAGSTITFDPSLAGQTIRLTNGALSLEQNYTIDASALSAPVLLDGNAQSPIFTVNAAVSATLNSLVITNGYAGANNWGGGIVNNGSLTLNDCALSGNLADNSAAGGAIYNGGNLSMSACALSGNSAGFGAAIGNRADCSLANCTIANNTASANGGAIDNAYGAIVNLVQCTIAGNTASGAGGGFDNYQATVNVTNTIVGGNSGDDIYNWASSTVDFGGSNLVQILDNDGTTNGADSIIAAAPLLAALGDYGGPTQTMPPLAGSPAIDAGAPTALTTDQRGYPRPAGRAPDIGAVEGIYNTAGPGELTSVLRLGDGSIQFGFTNFTDSIFPVLASTNLTIPLSNWTQIGFITESPPGSGHYSFTDPTATTNDPERFYRVKSF